MDIIDWCGVIGASLRHEMDEGCHTAMLCRADSGILLVPFFWNGDNKQDAVDAMCRSLSGRRIQLNVSPTHTRFVTFPELTYTPREAVEKPDTCTA